MKQFVIITAGGTGQRMGSDIPKQFLAIQGEIILMKSILAFYTYDNQISIVLTLPDQHISYWNELCKKKNFSINHSIVKGGNTRFHSIQNALKEIPDDGIVAIHDGVRPLVSRDTIAKTFELAALHGNAIPYTDIADSLRFVDSEKNYPVDRTKLKSIQTPQTFICKIIKEAYKQKWDEFFTDDASVVEKTGITINLVPGNPENIKITTSKDLKVAEALADYLSE
jgi:2-C-methyl-D-erythritol 4-phosphate cytidylyltransferase